MYHWALYRWRLSDINRSLKNNFAYISTECSSSHQCDLITRIFSQNTGKITIKITCAWAKWEATETASQISMKGSADTHFHFVNMWCEYVIHLCSEWALLVADVHSDSLSNMTMQLKCDRMIITVYLLLYLFLSCTFYYRLVELHLFLQVNKVTVVLCYTWLIVRLNWTWEIRYDFCEQPSSFHILLVVQWLGRTWASPRLHCACLSTWPRACVHGEALDEVMEQSLVKRSSAGVLGLSFDTENCRAACLLSFTRQKWIPVTRGRSRCLNFHFTHSNSFMSS